MPITSIGPVCARRGCSFPLWKDVLCNRCWRLDSMFGKRDAVELPWEALTGLLADPPPREA